ncbi:MAG: cardiolipin synthase [Thiomonas sp.]|nr:cardiolipin synthase [Thiomonas sp.]
MTPLLLLLLHLTLALTCAVHVLLRAHRQPESRVAWLLMLLAFPYLGVLAYLLFGTTQIGRRRAERLGAVARSLPRPDTVPGWPTDTALPTEQAAPLFRLGASISGYPAVGGNRAELMADSNAAIARIVADIDAARHSVHLLFYIWLDDHNGRRVADALCRAAARGVSCRALVDDLGSHTFIRSAQWPALAAAGVHVLRALPVGNPLLRALRGRIDLRNHRKIVVIDNRLAYSGSQNCADPAFLPKAKYGPWVDLFVRFEGPVVRENQHLFATDWMGNGGDDLTALLAEPLPPVHAGFIAQVIATGPTDRTAAMPELFESLLFAARHELVITTPYYVPVPALQAALCAAANRGVSTTLILPARNDDFAVAATSRSHYRALLEAGVRIYEFGPGLLHTKSITVDTHLSLIGSANMDRRSFDLNYENNILVLDTGITAALRERQAQYLASSRRITLGEVAAWSAPRQLWQNALATLGPIL